MSRIATKPLCTCFVAYQPTLFDLNFLFQVRLFFIPTHPPSALAAANPLEGFRVGIACGLPPSTPTQGQQTGANPRLFPSGPYAILGCSLFFSGY